MAIRIGIIHDDIKTMDALKTIIKAAKPFLELDFSCASIAHIERNNIISSDYKPDIVLVDMDMHDDTAAGFRVIEMYQQSKVGKPKIIILSQYCYSHMVKMLKQKYPNLVSGCINADNLFDEGVLARILMLAYENHPFIENIDKYHFTDRELEILKLLVIKGHTQKEIAETLGSAEGTINKHIDNIKKKTKVNSLPLLIKMGTALF